MNVQPIPGEGLRFHVESQTMPGQHYVCDLSENQGHGECCCKRYTTTAGPRIRKGEPLWTERTACAHLRACWRWWAKETLTRAARQQNTPSTIDTG